MKPSNGRDPCNDLVVVTMSADHWATICGLIEVFKEMAGPKVQCKLEAALVAIDKALDDSIHA